MIVQSFENFVNFLNDDTIDITHEFLWDIVCSSNKLLFPSGLNLIILEINDDDITENVSLVCPTNKY